jgi:hypothetical protein
MHYILSRDRVAHHGIYYEKRGRKSQGAVDGKKRFGGDMI